MRTAALSLLVVLTASGAAAQVVHDGTDHYCTLRVLDGVARSGASLDPDELRGARLQAGQDTTILEVTGTGSSFKVRYIGFTPQARDAFQSAVAIWAEHIDSPIQIRVDAQFGPLASDVLGSAGPPIIGATEAGRSTWYPFALADLLFREDLCNEAGTGQVCDEAGFNPDIEATFNSAFTDFYFGTDANPPNGQFDFRSIVLHELGHGLGFVGSGDYDDGIVTSDNDSECDGVEGHGCWGIRSGTFFAPLIYDRLVEDASGVAMISLSTYPQNSEALGNLLTSNGVTTSVDEKEIFLDGTTIREANGGNPAPIYAPRPSEVGSSFSHWDEFIFRPSGGSNALMTPGIARGEAYSDPGPLTCGLLEDMGWDTTANCSALFPVAEAGGPEVVALSLVRLGANPFRTTTAFRLVAPGGPTVAVRLVDALGRTVADLYDGPVAPAGVRVDVDGRALAPGVYVVQVLGAGAPLAAPIIRTR